MIRIGPAGWSYKDWEDVVYPPNPPKGFHGATYLAQFFDTEAYAGFSEFWLTRGSKLTLTYFQRVASAVLRGKPDRLRAS